MPAVLQINGETLHADVSGAAWWPRERALLLADLHLEKGSSYARSGQLLPPYDTTACLRRLNSLVMRYQPAKLFFLGDTFHDPFAGERLPAGHAAFLAALTVGRDLVWIAGNHDPAPPADLPGMRAADIRLGGLHLVHQPSKGAVDGEVCGHLHPVARVQTRAAMVRRRCFIDDGRRLMLPAFGAYTGGINVRDPVIADLFTAPRVHVLGDRRVLAMAAGRLV